MKKNSIFVYVLLPLLGSAAGYTFALNTAPYTLADSTPSQTSPVEPASPAQESVASVASGLRNGAPDGDSFPPQPANSDSYKTEQITDNITPATLAEENHPASQPEYEQYPNTADQASLETRITLVQTLPVRENLDTLTHLLLEDPLPDVRRTVLERLATGDMADDVSITNTLDAVLMSESDASVIRTALDYYKNLGEQYAYNACLALIQRDDLSAFSLGQAFSFLVDNELIGQGDATYYVMQSPSFATLDSDERDYMVNGVLAQSAPPDEQEYVY